MDEMNVIDDLQKITAIIKDNKAVVSNNNILTWMQSKNLEVLGAIYYLISSSDQYKKIFPGLSAEQYCKFIMHYFTRCMNERPNSDLISDDWAVTRYEAGWDLVRWFKNFWSDSNVPRYIVNDLKKWLENIYKNGDEDLRECLISATLEHLLDNKEIVAFFSDWLSDPVLKQAFDRSIQRAGKIFGP